MGKRTEKKRILQRVTTSVGRMKQAASAYPFPSPPISEDSYEVSRIKGRTCDGLSLTDIAMDCMGVRFLNQRGLDYYLGCYINAWVVLAYQRECPGLPLHAVMLSYLGELVRDPSPRVRFPLKLIPASEYSLATLVTVYKFYDHVEVAQEVRDLLIATKLYSIGKE